MAERIRPKLLLHKLMIFESISPVKELRTIPFTTGLNIIWGQDSNVNADDNLDPNEMFSGHSVGKTSLCRLIRYCLGEESFGRRKFMQLIVDNFPTGYVALELCVNNQIWSVLRPFDRKNGCQKAMAEPFSEVIFNIPAEDIPYYRFVEDLENNFIKSLPINTIPGSDKTYSWSHLLAWLTRDQEARFQNFYQWRAARSESPSMHWDSPEKDAISFVRIMLGLLNNDEINCLSQIESWNASKKEKKTELEKLLAGKVWEVEHYRKVLYNYFSKFCVSVTNPDDLFEGETAARQKCQQLIQNKISGYEKNQQDAERFVQLANHMITRWNETISSDFAIKEFSDDFDKIQTSDQNILSLRDYFKKTCIPGNIRYRDCKHYQCALEQQEQKLKIQSPKSEIEQQPVIEKLGEDTLENIAELHKKVMTVMQTKRKEQHRISRLKALSTGWKRKYFDFIEISNKYDMLRKQEKLSDESAIELEIQKHNESIKAETSRLESLKLKYRIPFMDLEKKFKQLVVSIFSKGFDGNIRGFPEKMTFSIDSAIPGMNGEAVESLSVVLADIVCMINGAFTFTHPCFLLHDSPREADLSSILYKKFLANIENAIADVGLNMEYQYIVTTTSEPPEILRDKICLRLNSASEDGLLFRKRVLPIDKEGLFE